VFPLFSWGQCGPAPLATLLITAVPGLMGFIKIILYQNFLFIYKFIHDILELNLTKLKLEYLNLALSVKEKDINTDQYFYITCLDFFEFSSSLLLEYCYIFSTLK